MAQVRADPGGELVEGERLGHIVGRPRIEAANAILDLPARGEQDHGEAWKRAANRREDLESVATRKHQVEQHEIKIAAQREDLALLAIGGPGNGVAVRLESTSKEIGDPCLILNEQDPHLRGIVGTRGIFYGLSKSILISRARAGS